MGTETECASSIAVRSRSRWAPVKRRRQWDLWASDGAAEFAEEAPAMFASAGTPGVLAGTLIAKAGGEVLGGQAKVAFLRANGAGTPAKAPQRPPHCCTWQQPRRESHWVEGRLRPDRAESAEARLKQSSAAVLRSLSVWPPVPQRRYAYLSSPELCAGMGPDEQESSENVSLGHSDTRKPGKSAKVQGGQGMHGRRHPEASPVLGRQCGTRHGTPISKYTRGPASFPMPIEIRDFGIWRFAADLADLQHAECSGKTSGGIETGGPQRRDGKYREPEEYSEVLDSPKLPTSWKWALRGPDFSPESA
ncbi:hypothetical protein Micbo1qcDRAFT_178600 [Microdochium bolleyi]|uniref:Uncharacterized protein n=1 Tax=Microdochium bolleyi TaxID=196109 RepID=A0A136ISM1_9PEZI|nr:hypothetical protein Micbo1qcDRAFT_178600 [Microdochium bolleyi]